MSQWLKLIQCKYTPSSLFTIYDYTKIVYPIDNNFYLKQVVTPSQKSSFIPIKHNFDKIHSIHGALNNIITVEQIGAIFYVGFYATNAQEDRLRITWNINDKPNNTENSIVSNPTVNGSLQISHVQHQTGDITIRSLYSQEILMICATDHQGTAHQIVMVHCKEKRIIGRGFVEGNIHDIAIGPNCSISLYLNKSIVAYKNQPTLDQQMIGRLYKQAQASINVEIEHHFWIEDELMVWGKNKAYIIIKNKINQEFSDFHRLHNATALVCGFIACDGCVIKVYKKKNIQYQLICEIVDEHLMECKNLSLSPQQDILAYFTPNSDSLVVSSHFNDQIEQAQLKDNAMHMAITLKHQQIGHHKSYDYTIYSSAQSWFASVNGTVIRLINSHNYQQFLSIQLATEDKDKSYISSDLKPRHLAIHPTRPIFAVALKKMVRLYYVTFNQIKLLKQFNVSMVGYLLFNKSGSLLTAVVAGKVGAKLYISKINQIKGDFSLLETITVGKKPIALQWDSLDCTLYSFHKQGYYSLSLLNKFKQRKQVTLKFKSEVTGALLSRQDTPIYWGNGKAIPILQQIIQQQQSIKQANIQQISLQGDYYYIVFDDGKISRCKQLDLQTSYSKAITLSNKGRKFEIRMQEGNKIIYLSQDLNVKYYQYGSGTSTFTDVVGVEKKKLYQIMGKHKQYQNQIKHLKQQFSSIVTQIKAKAIAEQQKIEHQYKYQLKDHVQREKKVKEEKNKLEEIMEKNLEIKQKQSMHQIKQLERLYQRKIALTTNKLLTQKQIGYRDKILADNNLKHLEGLHSEGIEKVRKQFGDQLKNQLFDRTEAQKQLNVIKKQYEARLYQLQEENQILLKGLQQKNQTSIIALKKMVNNWENKYSQCISQKDNVQKQYDQQLQICALLKQKISFLEVRKMEAQRRGENLSAEIGKLEGFLQERNKTLQFYEKRIQDLQKSNEILKYRVLQVKQQNDPYQAEITKLKQNLTDLEQEYEKLIKSSYQQQQKTDIIKKQRSKLKQDNEINLQKYLKLSKRYQQLLDKIRQTTKSPIQQIRKQLLTIVDSYVKINKSAFSMQKRADSPLGELNRIRDHLEVCLDEAVTTNKKNEEQRKIQMTKKNRENSELIIQINTMRKKIKQLQQEIREKNLKISRLIRGETPTVISLSKQDKVERTQKIEPTQAQSKQFTKTRSRQTFYEKNMFKSGTHWNKRLKTEQGSRRKKSSMSMMRERNNPNSLYIHPTQNDEIEQYKRIIEQKDIFIQKLIAKIQKS